MATQKLNKSFVLSDSSVNKYGMRLMTDGYLMDEFLKNPIGYYGHKKDEGVLIKWEDIQLDGDKVIGTPVINLGHPRAARTIQEVEEGFLNAASAGKLVIMEYHLDDNPEDAEEPIIVVTKWYNKEYSLVDIPGNRNALTANMELVDGDDNEFKISDIRNAHIENLKNSNKMKKVTLELTPALMGLLNLSDDKATAEAVIAGIQDLSDENGKLTVAKNTAEAALKSERETTAKARIAAVLDKGLADGKLNVATRKTLEKQYGLDRVTELEELISDMPKYQSLTDRLADGDFPKELSDKSYDELHKMGKIADVRDKYPEKYKALYKAKYGREPKVDKK